MTFELTVRLTDEILNALENQEKEFLIDADKGCLIEKTEDLTADEEKLYKIPDWTSADGFRIREDFLENLHSPAAREELQEILHSGRGVFKNFKNTLKKYPEVDKKWHIFKNRIMKFYINDWYNELRELWGLEKLDQFPESDENLIHDDFSFNLFNPETDTDRILQIHKLNNGGTDGTPEEIKTAMDTLWQRHFLSYPPESQTGFICTGISEDFAGCITAAPVSEQQENLAVLTSFFVNEQFRGLGIGTELLSMCLAMLKKNGIRWILLPNIIIPEIIRPLLTRNGFEQTGYGYAAKLQN